MLTLVMVDQWGTTLKPVPHSTDPSLMPSSTKQLTCPLGQVGNRLRNFFQYITYFKVHTTQFDLVFTVPTPPADEQLNLSG